MGSELKQQFGVEVELVASSGGVFEIKVDNALVFSKKKLLRFPEDGEIQNLLKGP